jgi:hypothetical protein
MKKLNDLISRIQALEKAAAEIDKLENKCRADIKDVIRANVAIDVQKQKISDIRLSLDLVDAKREKVMQPLEKAMEELHAEYFHSIGMWNAAVLEIKKAMLNGIRNSFLPQFGGDMSACEQFFPDWKFEEIPFALTLRHAFEDTLGREQIYQRNPIQNAQAFIRHVEKFAPLLKVDLTRFE